MHAVLLAVAFKFCTGLFPVATIVPYQQYNGQCPFTAPDGGPSIYQCVAACGYQVQQNCYPQCNGLSGSAKTSCEDKCAAQQGNCDNWCYANC